MKVERFNEMVKDLQGFFDGATFRLQLGQMSTILLILPDGKLDNKIELHFSSHAGVENCARYDQIQFKIEYEWADYDESKLSPAELSAVKAIIAVFQNEDDED
jgi:hypothetical protein